MHSIVHWSPRLPTMRSGSATGLAILLLFAAIGIAAGSARALASGDAFSAGFSELSVSDPVSGKTVPVGLWYPATGAEADLLVGPFSMHVASDGPIAAPPAGSRFPLVVMSHGSGASHLMHRDTAVALARAGFVVAAPMHARDNFQDEGGAGDDSVLEGRARTLSLIIGKLAAAPKWIGVIETTKVGVVGYSAGGTTALSLLGAMPDRSEAVRHCKATPKDAFCRYVRFFKDAGTSKPIAGLKDDRIAAAVVMAPVAAMFSDLELAKIDQPIRIYVGAGDEELSPVLHAGRIARIAGQHAELVTVEKAGHFSFLAPFPVMLASILPELAGDADGFDREAFHQRMNGEIVAFFEAQLGVAP